MKRLNNLSKEEWAKHNNTVWKCFSDNGYFASFDEEIPKRLIKYFTFPKDKVLDPFVGSGTTLKVAQELGRHAIGIDCNENAIRLTNKKIKSENKLEIEARVGDSRKLSKIEDDEIDFIVTSPPYFNIVNYSKQKNQIGNTSEYNKFMDDMVKVFQNCKRVLKKGKYMAIVTADIRKASNYYPIHVDYIHHLKQIDFKIHQILINRFQTSGREKREKCMGYPSNFHPWMEHEYILIFQL